MSSVLWTGIFFFSIHLENIHSSHLLKRIYRGFETDVGRNFNMRIKIPSQPWALLISNVQIVLVSVLKSESLVKVPKFWLLERELPLLIGLPRSLKSHSPGFLCLKNQLQIRYLLERVILMESLTCWQMKMTSRFLEQFWVC